MSKHRRACLHFDAPGDCSGGFVRSHTIQRAALARIADDSHVLGFIPSFPALLRGRHLPKRLGISMASTMTCFCGKHDNALFAPLEDTPFTATHQQLLLLAYRAWCWQIFANEWKVNHQLPLLSEMDRGTTIEEQVAFQIDFAIARFGALTASKIFEGVKSIADAKLRSGDFSGLRFAIVEFSEVPTVASCGARVPVGDFAGRPRDGLDTMRDIVPVTFALIPSNGSGTGVFSWLGDSPSNDELVNSLKIVKDPDVADAMIRFAFTYIENTFMSPSWWKVLPTAVGERLTVRMRESAAADSLVDDGIHAAAWTVGRRTLGTT